MSNISDMIDERTYPILYWHYNGYTNAEIAKKLGLDEEYVHDYIVQFWAWDNKVDNRRTRQKFVYRER